MRETSNRAVCASPKGAPALLPSFINAESAPRGPVRPSRTSKRRAIFLVAIHVVILAHLVHWKIAGTTVSPLEPSEAMYTIRDGIVNAGAILLVLSILSTLVLGRFFCGWGCHVVALQDASAWLLKKVGIRPRPLRSRWLMVVPVFAGLYMFLWPRLMGWLNGFAAPRLQNGIMKHDFWETFPGFWIGALTFLVCGFAIVYLLGAKGFCTYACPYGGLFGVADRFAVGRIRVTDACKQCGHCTAVCTSNVVVHKEVLEYGMVVDPGCMKCRDCISVCPENALYFGFGKPALWARARRAVKKVAPQFSWREEASLLLLFGLTLAILSGVPHLQVGTRVLFAWSEKLYGQVPLLFALGLSAISAFLFVMAARRVRAARSADLPVRSDAVSSARADGSPRSADLPVRSDAVSSAFPARLLVAAAIAWGLFLAHSAWVQVHTWTGMALLDRDEAAKTVVWWQNKDALAALPADARSRWARGDAHLAAAERIGIVPDARLPRERSWAAMARGDLPAAAAFLDTAARRAPKVASTHRDLAHVALLLGDTPRARRALDAALALDPNDLAARGLLVAAHVTTGDYEAAIAGQREIASRDPSPIGRFRLATMLLDGPTPADGIAELRTLLAAHEGFAPGHAALGVALDQAGKKAEAAPHLRRAEELQPGILGAVKD